LIEAKAEIIRGFVAHAYDLERHNC